MIANVNVMASQSVSIIRMPTYIYVKLWNISLQEKIMTQKKRGDK